MQTQRLDSPTLAASNNPQQESAVCFYRLVSPMTDACSSQVQIMPLSAASSRMDVWVAMSPVPHLHVIIYCLLTTLLVLHQASMSPKSTTCQRRLQPM
jgi:hypothetical protein